MPPIDETEFLALCTGLRRALADEGLRGERQEQRAYFSPELAYGRHFGPPAPTARQAAVMILLEPREDGWSIPLTVRPTHLPDHPGQISLPGGRLEGQETPQQAAERELIEELGCHPFPGSVLGCMSPLYVFNSDYYVVPFVALANRPSCYEPCEHEVEQLLHLPLSCLHQPSCRGHRRFSRGWAQWRAATIEHHDAVIWGATAIILGEFSAITGQIPRLAALTS